MVKIVMILPSQRSPFSNLYEVYADLTSGLNRIGIKTQIVEVRTEGQAKYPFGRVMEVDGPSLRALIDELQAEDTFILGVDDYWFLKWLGGCQSIRNLVIWAHYLYGQKFLFKRYRNAVRGITNILSSYMPNELAFRSAKFYREPMSRYPIFGQSLWTSMLLEKYLMIEVEGVLYIPVESKIYDIDSNVEKRGVLVFIGGPDDTDLDSLDRTLRTLGDKNQVVDFFGDEAFGLKFEKVYGRRMQFIGKMERRELIRNYARYEVVIAPIFNGTFEMVPIHSLLAGTPVISFIQPFIEVVGESEMLANINNVGEIRRKSLKWTNLDKEIRDETRNMILARMDSFKVARNLTIMLYDLDLALS